MCLISMDIQHMYGTKSVIIYLPLSYIYFLVRMGVHILCKKVKLLFAFKAS